MQTPNAITRREFEDLIVSLNLDRDMSQNIAVGVSGGPDSMALCYLLSEYAHRNGGIEIHAISIDHGLRSESAEEARHVSDIISQWKHVHHQILHWDNPADTAIQEQARFARYDEMRSYCSQHSIQYLFLGHHLDDQAETFLFRLAKGSGLDGLSSMQSLQPYEGVVFVRPFLGIEKERLIATCVHHGIAYVDDPSNQNDDFARVRLREARQVLEAEGLSSKRLAQTALRLSRARDALDEMAMQCSKAYVMRHENSVIEIDWHGLQSEHEEIIHRVLWACVLSIGDNSKYGPRLLKFEDLVADLLKSTEKFKRTLGGVIWQCDSAAGRLILQKEAKS